MRHAQCTGSAEALALPPRIPSMPSRCALNAHSSPHSTDINRCPDSAVHHTRLHQPSYPNSVNVGDSGGGDDGGVGERASGDG